MRSSGTGGCQSYTNGSDEGHGKIGPGSTQSLSFALLLRSSFPPPANPQNKQYSSAYSLRYVQVYLYLPYCSENLGSEI
jgi:hypothetical protein